jgi:hypothetical protein
MLGRDRAFKDIDCLANPLREPFQGWDSRAGNSHIRVAEEYARGAFCIIVKFDRTARGYAHNRNKFSAINTLPCISILVPFGQTAVNSPLSLSILKRENTSVGRKVDG